MGVTFSEKEISSEEAYKLPTVAKFVLWEKSYYEMTHTHSLHYVRPLYAPSISLMITGELYSEERKEVLDRELKPLSEKRKSEILQEVWEIYFNDK